MRFKGPASGSAPICLLVSSYVSAFQQHKLWSSVQSRPNTPYLHQATPKDGDKEYKNTATKILSNFLPEENKIKIEDPLADIDFNVPKVNKMSLEDLAAFLDYELYEKEWFVTGKVNPALFADDFQFQDPDVKLDGIEEYARGVLKLFDQGTSRAEIISSVVNATVPDTITVTWRLSGKVNIGPGLPIKPYIIFTDFKVDPDTGLINYQEDRFDLPGWDILLSALFPFLIGKVTAPPAKPLEPRVVLPPKPQRAQAQSIFAKFFGK